MAKKVRELDVPDLSDALYDTLLTYRRLQRKYRRAPAYSEVANVRGVTKPAAQQAVNQLADLGLIDRVTEWLRVPVGGGITPLGDAALRKNRRRG